MSLWSICSSLLDAIDIMVYKEVCLQDYGIRIHVTCSVIEVVIKQMNGFLEQTIIILNHQIKF